MATPAVWVDDGRRVVGEVILDDKGLRFREGRKTPLAVPWTEVTSLEAVDTESGSAIEIRRFDGADRIEFPDLVRYELDQKLRQSPQVAQLLEGLPVQGPTKKSGLFSAMGGSWPLPEHVAQVLGRGDKAWQQGRRSFVYRQTALSGLNEGGLNDVVDGLLEIGWELKDTSLAFNTVGLNTEVIVMVFLRPIEADPTRTDQDGRP